MVEPFDPPIYYGISLQYTNNTCVSLLIELISFMYVV